MVALAMPVLIRCWEEADALIVRPENPLPGSQAYSRIDRIVQRLHAGIRHVVFDLGGFRHLDSRNLAVVAALLAALQRRGISEFTAIKVPRRGWAVLEALGLDRYFAHAGV